VFWMAPFFLFVAHLSLSIPFNAPLISSFEAFSLASDTNGRVLSYSYRSVFSPPICLYDVRTPCCVAFSRPFPPPPQVSVSFFPRGQPVFNFCSAIPPLPYCPPLSKYMENMQKSCPSFSTLTLPGFRIFFYPGRDTYPNFKEVCPPSSFFPLFLTFFFPFFFFFNLPPQNTDTASHDRPG